MVAKVWGDSSKGYRAYLNLQETGFSPRHCRVPKVLQVWPPNQTTLNYHHDPPQKKVTNFEIFQVSSMFP